MLRRRKNRGQSTIEYLVILSAIIAVVIIIAQGPFKTSLTNIMNRAVRRMSDPTVITDTMIPE